MWISVELYYDLVNLFKAFRHSISFPLAIYKSTKTENALNATFGSAIFRLINLEAKLLASSKGFFNFSKY